VSGRKPTYQPKVALQIDGVSPLRWAVSGRSPSSRPKVASTCNLSDECVWEIVLKLKVISNDN
jgi:hypothetical protein